MGLFWEGYVYQFGTRGACAPRSTPAGLARARADARAACSNHFVFQSSDQGEAGEVYPGIEMEDDDDDDVYYPRGRRPREDEEGEESYEKRRQRPGRGG